MADEQGKLPAAKPKIGLKRIKKKPKLNISKGNLKSITTPKKFSYLNMSVQKQSLRANNKALAQSLSRARLELRTLNAEHQSLKVFNQDLIQELNKLKRLVGIKDDEVEEEVQKRMQAHVKEIKSSLEELSQNMLHSSVLVSALNENCLRFARRSTASSRADSLGNVSTTSDGSLKRSFNQRNSASFRNRKQNSLMMKYLSHADEFSPPPRMESPTDFNRADMSVIDEQSFVAEEPRPPRGFLSTNKQIPIISENPIEDIPAASRLPQRIPKSKKNPESLPVDKETILPDPLQESNITTSRRSSKAGGKRSAECVAVVSDNELGILDIDSDFTAELVSASPITKHKPGQLQKERGTNKEGNSEKSRREAFVLDKESIKSDLSSTKKQKVVPKAAKSEKVKVNSKPQKDTLKVKSSTYVNKSPNSRAIVVPDIIVGPGLPASVDQFNPFKPSKTLLRSPLKGSVQKSASPVKKVDSVQFLASLTVQNDEISEISAEPSNFADENTIYFNSEMELTGVCDFSKVLQTSKNVNKKSPYISPVVGNIIEETDKRDKHITDKADKGKQASEASARHDQTDTHSKDTHDTATIEMRNKKPGVFTFSVGRKETDGTRKPVPDKPTRSRPKKAKNVTPEKEERKAGDDRDMFNFGDRTPTMPLEKILQTKSVTDLSNKDNSQPSFKKPSTVGAKEPSSKVTETNEHVYSVPLKDSPCEKKPVKSRGRSKSNTRSKSKSRCDDDSEEEWVPETKGRSRASRSIARSKKNLKDDDENDDELLFTAKKKSIGQQKEASSIKQSKEISSAIEDPSKDNVYSVPVKTSSPDGKKEASKGRSRSKSNTRSRLRVDDSDDEVIPERKSRSRSKKINDKEDMLNARGRSPTKAQEKIQQAKSVYDLSMNESSIAPSFSLSNYRKASTVKEPSSKVTETNEHVYSVPLKDSPCEKKTVKSRGRSKSNTRSKSKSRRDDDSEEEWVPETKGRSRASRSIARSKKSLKEDDEEGEEEDELLFTSKKKSIRPPKEASSIKQSKEISSAIEDPSKDNVYSVPVKTSSPDGKKEASKGRSRSKSNTRSRSRLRVDDSDDEVIPERKSRSRSKKVNDNDEDSPELKGISRTQSEQNSDVDECTINKHDEAIARISVRKSRPEKSVGDTSSKKVIDNSEEEFSSLSSKTPALTKSTIKQSSKSAVSKSSRKRRVETKAEDDTPKRIKVKSQEKEIVEDSEVKSVPSKSRLSTKTPALPKSSKKNSSKSTVSKSRGKRDVGTKEGEHTPRRKNEDASEHKENTPVRLSNLEMLKKRLTMVTSRMSTINTDDRKMSEVGLSNNDVENDGKTEVATKSRRTKTQVSYVPKPLNAKLRQGDSLFDEKSSKAKADDMRLQLAKKTSILQEFKN